MKRRLFSIVWAVCLFLGCSPLPVPHPERWAPDYEPTEYPSSSYAARPPDAGQPQGAKP